jgi:hypothetical protein
MRHLMESGRISIRLASAIASSYFFCRPRLRAAYDMALALDFGVGACAANFMKAARESSFLPPLKSLTADWKSSE